MRTVALAASRVALLTGPTVLAFASGGFSDEPRLIAGIMAWVLVAVAAVAAPRPMPAGWPGRLALAGLAGLSAWVALSLLWAPVAGPALHDAQRVVLYVGALIAAVALLRDRRAARAVEPVLASGVVVVVGYALSERLLPGVVHLTRTTTSQGRLEQPLTYWNAMGILGALGLVLAMRVAGDTTRPSGMRAAAAAAAAPLGLGVYLTLSRGALAAVAVGVVVLLAAAPTWGQLTAMGLALPAAIAAALTSHQLHGVASLSGSLHARERDGAVMFAVLGALMLATAALQLRAARRERHRRTGRLPLPAHYPLLAVGLVVLAVGVALLAGASRDRSSPPPGVTDTRLQSIQSNRYEYWRVALRAFGRHPILGIGSSGFAVTWRRERPSPDGALDAHSLYIETAAELGVVGLALLALVLGGVALAARAALRRDAVLAAGWCAATATWAIHAGLDWDWEMPAVTLVALVLAGALIAAGDTPVRAAPDT